MQTGCQHSYPRAVLFGPMRLPFLILTPACVMLGTATAVWSGSALDPLHLLLVLSGALCAHISVNALNEYHDFRSGLDFLTRPTPYSGGSGTLPRHPEKARVAFYTALISLTITALVGIYFLLVKGLWLLPVGVLGLITVVVYTRWATRRPLLCLIAPGLGFGPLMVMGSNFALTGSYSWTAFVASLVPFFLVSDLLLLNQFPDVEADHRVGRRHLPIVIGKKASTVVYALFLAGAYVTIILGYLSGTLPPAAFLGLASIVLAVPTVRGVGRSSNDIQELIPYLRNNVVINILTPLLLATGLFIAR